MNFFGVGFCVSQIFKRTTTRHASKFIEKICFSPLIFEMSKTDVTISYLLKSFLMRYNLSAKIKIVTFKKCRRSDVVRPSCAAGRPSKTPGRRADTRRRPVVVRRPVAGAGGRRVRRNRSPSGSGRRPPALRPPCPCRRDRRCRCRHRRPRVGRKTLCTPRSRPPRSRRPCRRPPPPPSCGRPRGRRRGRGQPASTVGCTRRSTGWLASGTGTARRPRTPTSCGPNSARTLATGRRPLGAQPS